MAYDPRQMMRGGVPPSGYAQDDPSADAATPPWWTQQQQRGGGQQFAPAPAPAQPKQWYEGLPSMGKSGGAQSPQGGKAPPSLLDMLMASGGKAGGAAGAPPSGYGPIPGAGLMNSPWFLT